MRTKNLTWVIGISLFLFLTGCGPEDYGIAPPEVYDTPPPIPLTDQERGLIDLLDGHSSEQATALAASITDEEKSALVKFAPIAGSALTKIMKQKNAWRKIVIEHNNNARDQFHTMLEKSHIKDGQLQKLISPKESENAD